MEGRHKLLRDSTVDILFDLVQVWNLRVVGLEPMAGFENVTFLEIEIELALGPLVVIKLFLFLSR